MNDKNKVTDDAIIYNKILDSSKSDNLIKPDKDKLTEKL
jgi:hypothetical protein